jgi:hypothetical protein
MAGEFIKDPPLSADREAKKFLRKNAGTRGVGTSKGKQVTKSNGSVARGGKKITSGAANVRGGTF